jgi:hypothetical protein
MSERAKGALVTRKLALVATLGLLAITATMTLAACGGSSDSDDVASLGDQAADGSQASSDGGSTTGDEDPYEAALAYARCMREHGVDIPDPGPNGEIRLTVGPNDNPEKVEEAQAACQELMEDARPRLTEEQQNVMQDGLLAFAKCMRDHGVDMPDPQFGKGGIVTQRARAGSNFDPNDPKFQEAQKACEPILDEARREAGLPKPSGGPGFQRAGGNP